MSINELTVFECGCATAYPLTCSACGVSQCDACTGWHVTMEASWICGSCAADCIRAPQTADVLRAAAAMIERQGWVQNRNRGPGDKVCASEAIRCAAQEVLAGERAFAGADVAGFMKARDTFVAATGHQVADYNDNVADSAATVVAALRAAADTTDDSQPRSQP